MKTLFTATLFALTLVQVAGATNFYLSAKGNDRNDGTTKLTAWRTLRKLSEASRSMHPGDSIFLERGSVFYGTFTLYSPGSERQVIYVGAYGTGARPVISGAQKIGPWEAFRTNVWVADCARTPGDVFVNGKIQRLGRYPNKGYLTITSGTIESLTDTAANFQQKQWDNAQVVVRSGRFTIDKMPLKSIDKNTLIFSTQTSYALQPGFGYFIQAHINTLDSPGEWYYDAEGKKLYVYFGARKDPHDFEVEISAAESGLQMKGVSHVEIENLSFTKFRDAHVRIEHGVDIAIRNSDFSYSANNGLEISHCANVRVENSLISDSNNNGVEWKGNKDGYFVRNRIRRTGMLPGRGADGNGTYIALNITSEDPHAGKNLFQFNTIDTTGYLGIDFRTGHTQIRNNLIRGFCMIKDDGAGIYTWDNTYGDNFIDNNIVLNGIGAGEGTSEPNRAFVAGIYIDDRSRNIAVTKNMVSYCATAGIFVHNATDLTISDNTLAANGFAIANKERGQFYLKLDTLVPRNGNALLGLVVTKNKFVATTTGRYCVYLSAERKSHLNTPGNFRNNQYWASEGNAVLVKDYDHNVWCEVTDGLSLAQWQTEGHDEGSTFRLLTRRPDKAAKNLIANGDLGRGTEGWYVWPDQAGIAFSTQPKGLEVKFGANKEALLYHSGFALETNKVYRLVFKAMSPTKNKVEFVPMMANAPWHNLGDYTCFAVDSIKRTFTYYFTPSQPSKNARVNFKSNAPFWISDVSLQEVPGDAKFADDPAFRVIYNASIRTAAVSLTNGYSDIHGNEFAKSVALEPYASVILLRQSDMILGEKR
ncbi:MAG TPA: right-handed parallel beta-helix repeat-containing protein [Cyclobacteriaceae bacterium]|nr:right-handed parallel beta-helix repeat-containing protein [Cyclobacteriaceae bacterium]